MLMKFGAEEIAGHRILPDGSGVGISFKTHGGEDTIELLLPTKNVQGAFTILADILTALGNVAQPQEAHRVNARFPDTFRVSISKQTMPPTVALVFDAGRPTQSAYAVAPHAARLMGQAMLAQAREAEQAASQHAAANPKPSPQPEASK